MNKLLKLSALSSAVAVMATPAAFADGMVTVDSNDMHNWLGTTVEGGTTMFVDGAPAGLGSSSLQLKTTSSNLDKATYAHEENIKLSDLASASYWTKQETASSLGGSASMTLGVDLNGDGTWDTNLVFEPYWQNELSADPSPVTSGDWQQWDVKGGMLWSSRSYGTGDVALTAGHGGAPFYTLENIMANYPSATIVGIGVGVGTYNPDYAIDVDGIELNGTTYNFEKVQEGNVTPTSKEDCKKDGWKTLHNVDGRMFRNQGQCVSFMAKQQTTTDTSMDANVRATVKSER
jgi:hypothetical protein